MNEMRCNPGGIVLFRARGASLFSVQHSMTGVEG